MINKRFSENIRPKPGTLCYFSPTDGRTTFIKDVQVDEICVVIANSRYCTVVSFEHLNESSLVCPEFLVEANMDDVDDIEDIEDNF